MNVVVEIFSICTGYLSSHPEPIGGVIHSVDQLDRDHTGSWQEQSNMWIQMNPILNSRSEN